MKCALAVDIYTRQREPNLRTADVEHSGYREVSEAAIPAQRTISAGPTHALITCDNRGMASKVAPGRVVTTEMSMSTPQYAASGMNATAPPNTHRVLLAC